MVVHILAPLISTVAVAYGAGDDRCDIAAVVGFAVAHAYECFTGDDRGDDAGLLLVRADGIDDAGDHQGDRDAVVWCAGFLELVEQHIELEGVALAHSPERLVPAVPLQPAPG